jgi:predicted glycosyltransferase
MEQFIRASRAEDLGLARMLLDDGVYHPAVMARALRELPFQRLPSSVVLPGLLEGLVSVNRLVEPWLTREESAEQPATAKFA